MGTFRAAPCEATGVAYEESLITLFRLLDLPLEELRDWNCCGATSYMSIDEGSAFVLSARNLALAASEQASRPAGALQRLLPGAAQDPGLCPALSPDRQPGEGILARFEPAAF